jgi:hypothetical protein
MRWRLFLLSETDIDRVVVLLTAMHAVLQKMVETLGDIVRSIDSL